MAKERDLPEGPDSGLWAEAELAAARLAQVKPDVARLAAAERPAVPGRPAPAGALPLRSRPPRRAARQAAVAQMVDAPLEPHRARALQELARGGRSLTAAPSEPAPPAGSWVGRLLVLVLLLAVGAAALAWWLPPDLAAVGTAVYRGLRSRPEQAPDHLPGQAPGPDGQAPGHGAGGQAGAPAVLLPLTPAPAVTVVVGGDVMLGRGIASRLGQPPDVLFPFGRVVEPLRSADLAVVNLEGVVATSGQPEQKPYTFRMPPAALETLLAAGISGVSLANNHTMDFGPEAFLEQLGLLERKGIRYFGAGRHRWEAQQPAVWDIKGTRIAFLGIAEVELAAFGATATTPGTFFVPSDEEVRQAIQQARAMADFVVVMPHWGEEYREQPSARQRALARVMVEAGADLVLGAHPHVRQTVEFVNGRPVVYSLGNLVFDGMDGQPGATAGHLARFQVSQGELLRLELLPVRISPAGEPAPAPEEAGGQGWLSVVGGAVALWRGDPDAVRSELVLWERLEQEPSCPYGRYRVVRTLGDGIGLEREGFSGSAYWLAPPGDPSGCAFLPRDLLGAVAKDLRPGAPVLVPAGAAP